MTPRARTRRRAVAGLAVLALVALGVPASASTYRASTLMPTLASSGAAAASDLAETTRRLEEFCRRDGDTLVLAQDGRVFRSGDTIQVYGHADDPDCNVGVAEINQIAFTRTEPDETEGPAVLDLSGGPFAPGLTAEPDGTSEIEFEVDFGGEDPDEKYLAIDGGRAGTPGGAGDYIRVARPDGESAVNLNAAVEGSASDFDVSLGQIESLLIDGDDGNDILLADKGPGVEAFAEPVRLVGGGGSDVLSAGSAGDLLHGDNGTDSLRGNQGDDITNGGGGSDTLKGGPGAEILNGSSGRDRIDGGAGRDRIWGGRDDDAVDAEDSEHDRVDCGAGKDIVLADPNDHVVDCEAIDRRR